MRKVPKYEINLFWEDNTPVEEVKDTFSQIQMNRFLAYQTIELLDYFPKERSENLVKEILKIDLGNLLLK